MKKTYPIKGWLGLALSFIFTTQADTQVREPFDQLDLSSVSSHFFYPQTAQTPRVPDAYSYDNVLDAGQTIDLVLAFDQACLDPDFCIDDFGEFRNTMRENANQVDCIPISILDITYHDFISTALAENLIYFENGKFYDTPERLINPLIEKDALVSWMDLGAYRNEVLHFKVEADWYKTNRGNLPSIIQMDFDDGLGFRTVNFGEVIDVDYSVGNQNRIIRTRITRSGIMQLRSAFVLKFKQSFYPCETTTFPFPNVAPWPCDASANSEWQLSVPFNETVMVKGNAYTLTSADGIFDKPFIFVEGVDFGRDEDNDPVHRQYQNGTFGWCEFSSGFMDPNSDDQQLYGYDMLHRMPELLNEIRTYGYDIVLVDFYDGADYMERNSVFLQHVITMCNQYKAGEEPIVVSGASMGGQISRHALREMELNGTSHCARLWISMDSPHSGANIPRAMQEGIAFAANNGKQDAINLKNDVLLRPAACQLLRSQKFCDLGLYHQWYQNINALGYPGKCRTVSIANGRGDGVAIATNAERMMDWQCDISLTTPAKQYFFHNAGNPYHTLSNGEQNFLGQFRIPLIGETAIGDEWWSQPPMLLGIPTLPGLILDAIDYIDGYAMTPVGQDNWDYAPGGLRNSVQVYAYGINSELQESTGGNLCDEITADKYNANHCFIPTQSAIGLSDLNPYTNLQTYLDNNPQEKKFDRIEFAEEDNESHVEVTEHNMEIVLEEVLGPDKSGLGSELTSASPNNGMFNYGKPEFALLRNIHIHNGGKLYIHKNSNTHFNQNLDYLNIEGEFEVVTNECSPAEVVIENNGHMEIGDESLEGRRAALFLNRDSKLIVGLHGGLTIYKDSRLIIGEGAESIIYAGSDVVVDRGGIVVESGGKITIKAGSSFNSTRLIALLHDESYIKFNGGTLFIEPQTTFAIHAPGVQTGYIEILAGTENMLHTGYGSVLKLEGIDNNDVVLKLNNGAHLQNADWQRGSIELKTCKIEMNNHGAIYTDMYLHADDVLFEDAVENNTNDTGSEVWVWNNSSVLKNCRFEDVKLAGHEAKNFVHNTKFNGHLSGMDIYKGGYYVNSGSFDGCQLKSDALQLSSTILNSNFKHGGNDQVEDESLVEVFVKRCSFEHSLHFGINKQGGKLTVSCSDFEDMNGIKMQDGTLNLSGNDRGGYNTFSDVDVCIELINAEDIWLADGYNDFTGFFDYCIIGSLNHTCNFKNNCSIVVDAIHNFWGYYGSNELQSSGSDIASPDPSFFDVHGYSGNGCTAYDGVGLCQVEFLDTEPTYLTGCPDKFEIVVKNLLQTNNENEPIEADKYSPGVGMLKDLVDELDCPIINTPTFNEVDLDSALVYAAMQMEAYDSLANDANAVSLFNEILTTDLDRSNMSIRSKMNWGRYCMKSALENMFLQSELSAESNDVAFQTPVQQYVDVLNLMTDTALTDSTYKPQFYLELDKGQLFRTIGKLNIAQHVFEHLDDCELDSLEQSMLNNWRQQIDLELSLDDQLLNGNISPNSVDMVVDTTAYEEPVSLDVSDFYFGLWIDSPQSVTFVSCGENPVYRWAGKGNGSFSVFPNPARDHLNISGLHAELKYDIQLFDLQGKNILNISIPSGWSRSNVDVPLDSHLASGSYILRMSDGIMTEDHQVVISK